MRPIAPLLTAIALTLAAGPPASAEELEQRLHGEYTSNHHRGKKRLDVTLTPLSEGRWSVVFRFDWDGRRTYTGVAEGSLEGQLEGTVLDESRRRRFTFRGEFVDGIFEGTHFEVPRRGRERRTGTLVLRR